MNRNYEELVRLANRVRELVAAETYGRVWFEQLFFEAVWGPDHVCSSDLIGLEDDLARAQSELQAARESSRRLESELQRLEERIDELLGN